MQQSTPTSRYNLPFLGIITKRTINSIANDYFLFPNIILNIIAKINADVEYKVVGNLIVRSYNPTYKSIVGLQYDRFICKIAVYRIVGSGSRS